MLGVGLIGKKRLHNLSPYYRPLLQMSSAIETTGKTVYSASIEIPFREGLEGGGGSKAPKNEKICMGKLKQFIPAYCDIKKCLFDQYKVPLFMTSLIFSFLPLAPV